MMALFNGKVCKICLSLQLTKLKIIKKHWVPACLVLLATLELHSSLYKGGKSQET